MPAILTHQQINQLTKKRAMFWIPFGLAAIGLSAADRAMLGYTPLDKVEGFPPALAEKADEKGVVSVPAIAKWLDENHDRRISREELSGGKDLAGQLSSNWYRNVGATRANLNKAIELSEKVLEIEGMLNPEELK